MTFVINFLNPFYWLVCLRRYLYRNSFLKSKKLKGVKVISVGNIELGGTGKTPFAIAIATFLKNRGYNPLILSRGYGSRLGRNDYAWIKNSKILKLATENNLLEDADIHADEAMMCSSYLKDIWILIGAKRYDNFEKFVYAMKNEPKVTHVILDDGLQHLQIKRDIDIVLLNDYSLSPYAKILPFGKLRESPMTLKYVDYCIWTNQRHAIHSANLYRSLVQTTKVLVGDSYKQIFYLKNKSPNSMLELVEENKLTDLFLDRHFIGIFGIAKPNPLIEQLSHAYKIKLESVRVKRDHEIFSEEDNSWIQQRIKPGETVLISTLKDYFRSPVFFDRLENIVCLFLDKSYVEVFSESKEFEGLRAQLLEVE